MMEAVAGPHLRAGTAPAALRGGGCSPTWWRLQPCAAEAATLRGGGCNPTCRGGRGLTLVKSMARTAMKKSALTAREPSRTWTHGVAGSVAQGCRLDSSWLQPLLHVVVTAFDEGSRT